MVASPLTPRRSLLIKKVAEMMHTDFRIGVEFLARAGHRWRCTDVGRRTIVAIRLTGRSGALLEGPPYMAEEVVFDEHDIQHCHLTEEDAVRAADDEHQSSGRPGYPGDAVWTMVEASCSEEARAYPNQGVLRFDRLRMDGEILHPYAARKDDRGWLIRLYLPFCSTYGEMPEEEFIALPAASKRDVLDRAARKQWAGC